MICVLLTGQRHYKSLQASDRSTLSFNEALLSWWEWCLPGWPRPIHIAQGITEWFDEDNKEVSHMLWPSQSQHNWPLLKDFGVMCGVRHHSALQHHYHQKSPIQWRDFGRMAFRIIPETCKNIGTVLVAWVRPTPYIACMLYLFVVCFFVNSVTNWSTYIFC